LYEVVGEAHDEPTADLLTQRIGVHEQAAWMLRSMLEE
jgi:starvation-inducible DNA-binding protein